MDHWTGIIFLIFQGFWLIPCRSIHPSQECSLWNSLHFYVDLKGSTPKFLKIFAKYFVLLPFWFYEILLGFTWKGNKITWKTYKFTWKASLDLKGISGSLWIFRNTYIPIQVQWYALSILSIKKSFWELFY